MIFSSHKHYFKIPLALSLCCSQGIESAVTVSYTHQWQAGFTCNHQTLPSPLTPCHFPSAESCADGSPCTALLREAGNVSLHQPRSMALIWLFAQPGPQQGGTSREAPTAFPELSNVPPRLPDSSARDGPVCLETETLRTGINFPVHVPFYTSISQPFSLLCW